MTSVAAIQMTSGVDVARNLANASVLLREAQARGASVAALPENFAYMGLNEADKLAISEAPGVGPIQSFLAATASELKLWIVAGTIPMRLPEEPRVAAACIVYDDQGRAVARYDKIHLFDVDIPGRSESYRESSSVRPGVEPVVVDTPAGRLGLAVCYDLRFPELFRELLSAGRGMALPALGLHGRHRPRALGSPVARPGHRKSLPRGGPGPVRLPRKRPRNARGFDDHRPLGPHPGPIAARNRRSHGRIGLRTAARSAAEFSCRLPPPACAANDDPNKDIMKLNIPPPMFAPQPAALAAALGQREPLDYARTALLGPRRTRRESRGQRAGRRHGACGGLCRHLFPVDA